jgi:hypothetical protein
MKYNLKLNNNQMLLTKKIKKTIIMVIINPLNPFKYHVKRRTR